MNSDLNDKKSSGECSGWREQLGRVLCQERGPVREAQEMALGQLAGVSKASIRHLTPAPDVPLGLIWCGIKCSGLHPLPPF